MHIPQWLLPLWQNIFLYTLCKNISSDTFLHLFDYFFLKHFFWSCQYTLINVMYVAIEGRVTYMHQWWTGRAVAGPAHGAPLQHVGPQTENHSAIANNGHYCISVTASCLWTTPSHFMSTVLPVGQPEADCIVSYTVSPQWEPSCVLHAGQTAAVAVVSFWASERFRFRTFELVIVSKWDSGTQPRCRSESLVPSTQSVKKTKKKICDDQLFLFCSYQLLVY